MGAEEEEEDPAKGTSDIGQRSSDTISNTRYR
jgi:hypothetical protein